MHFPTSLPRSTGSPAANMGQKPRNISVHSVHSDPYDGPLPVLPKNRPRPLSYGRPQYRRRTNYRELPIPQATPVYSYAPQQQTSIHQSVSSDPRATAPIGLIMSGALQRSRGRTSSTSLITPSSNNTSVPNVDGASKILHTAPAKAKSKLRGIRSPEFRKMFSKKQGKPEEDPEDSPTEASEFYEIKRKKSEKSQFKAKVAEPSGEKSASSSRARLAARLLRHRGKTGDIETGLDLDDSDHHPFDAARKRLHDQRERKMRRKGASEASKPQIEEVSQEEEQHHPSHTHHLSDPLRRGVHFAGSREKLDTYQTSKVGDREELETRLEDGNRAGNAIQRLSTHITPTVEMEVGARKAGWASGDPALSNSGRASDAIYASTPSSSSPDELQIPRAADLPDLPPPPVPGFMKTSSQAPRSPIIAANQVAANLYGGPPASLRNNPYNQVMFPPKPPAPFFRPTLSPVSSRSPVPTSVGYAATVSPKRSLGDKEKSRPVSASPRMESLEQDPSASSLHLPLPEVSLPPTPPQKLGRLTIRNGAPNISTQTSGNSSPEIVLSPILEQPTPEPGTSRRSSQRSTEPSVQAALKPDDAVSSLNLECGAKGPVESPQKSTVSSRAVRIQVQSKHNSSSTHSVMSTQFSEIQRPRSPPPQPSPSPIKFSAQTPTASALEFWREADESLAPSESASAQPPNYRGEPPPAFWKAADKTLDSVRETGPTMEEWIASLPGLGLGLGSWGNSDGALDWKYFQTLKATRKLKKSRSGSSVKTTKSVQDMIEANMETLEKVIEDIEENNPARNTLDAEGLTPDEAEALDDNDFAEFETPVDNSPPTPVNLNFLHPEYRACSPIGGPILSSQRPQSRLGKDVAIRLDAIEKYWEEQSVAMGAVLKRMLVVVDNLIVKEREQAQKDSRRVEMGWYNREEDSELDEAEGGNYDEKIQLDRLSDSDGSIQQNSQWGCSVA